MAGDVVEKYRSKSAIQPASVYTRHVTQVLPARLVCLRCGERKVTITSPPDQQLLTFGCGGCGFAWSSLNLLTPPQKKETPPAA
jgi:transcription elongation factor Elf1